MYLWDCPPGRWSPCSTYRRTDGCIPTRRHEVNSTPPPEARPNWASKLLVDTLYSCMESRGTNVPIPSPNTVMFSTPSSRISVPVERCPLMLNPTPRVVEFCEFVPMLLAPVAPASPLEILP